MDLSVSFLGTGPSAPTARRSTAAVLVQRGGERMLFDCGEGTQRQLQRSLGMVEVEDVFLTHYHLDHVLGLPGLLKTWDLHDRVTPLCVHGPKGLKTLFGDLRRLIGRVGYPLELVELADGDRVERDGYAIHSFPVEHRVIAHGYALVEEPRPGRFDPERARALGVSPGPAFGELQRGRAVEGSGGAVEPSQVMGHERQGRSVVITGDTAPSETTRVVAEGAQLLVHDATFGDEDAERAAQTGHSTARQAGRLAADADVGLLCLVHVSSRYPVPVMIEQAREEFDRVEGPRDFDQVLIPFPERGEPELVPAGARGGARSSAAAHNAPSG